MSLQVRASKCKAITSATMAFVFTTGTVPMTTFTAHCIGAKKSLKPNFTGNYEKCRQKEGFKFFLIDDQEFKKMENVWGECKTEAEKDEKTYEILGSVTKFSNVFRKNIYVRMLPTKVGSTEPMRVFTDEILEILPIALKQQGTPIEENDARLAKYREEWDSSCSNWYTTIGTDQFEKILDEFNVDKRLVTLVEDPATELAQQEYFTGGSMVRTFSPDMKVVTDVLHAADLACTALVMGVNWNHYSCPDKDACKNKMTKEVKELLTALKSMRKGTFLSCQVFVEMIEDIKKICHWNYQRSQRCPDYMLGGAPHIHGTYSTHYAAVTAFFDLPTYQNFLPNKQPDAIPVWMFRMFCKLGWLQQFFSNEEDSNYKNMILEMVMFSAAPEQAKTARQFLVSILYGADGVNHENVGENSNEDAPNEGFEKMLADAMKRKLAISKKREAKKNRGQN